MPGLLVFEGARETECGTIVQPFAESLVTRAFTREFAPYGLDRQSLEQGSGVRELQKVNNTIGVVAPDSRTDGFNPAVLEHQDHLVYGAFRLSCVQGGSVPICANVVCGSHTNHHLLVPIGKHTIILKSLGLKNPSGLEKHRRNAIIGAEVAIESSGSGNSEISDLLLRERVHFTCVKCTCLEAGPSDEHLCPPTCGQRLDSCGLAFGHDHPRASEGTLPSYPTL